MIKTIRHMMGFALLLSSLIYSSTSYAGPSTLRIVGSSHTDLLNRRPDLDDHFCRQAVYMSLFSPGMVRVNFADSRKTLYTPINHYQIFIRNYGWSNCEVWTRKPTVETEKENRSDKYQCPKTQDWSLGMKRCIRGTKSS